MDSLRVVYSAHPDATPEAEISALTAIYKLCLDKKEAVPDRRPDDAERRSSDGATGKYKG